VASISAADVIALNATSVVMTREAIAATGTDATNAAVLTKQCNAITASDGTKGVSLPAAATTTGPIFVVNTVTTATLKVYPVNGGNDNINGLAEDAAFTMGPGKSAWFTPVSATQWWCDDFAACTTTTGEINNAADVSARVQTLTSSGAITAGVQCVQLNHASTPVVTTIANAANHQGLFVVKDISATGTAAHTLTLTAGTFNGINNVATLNALNECLVVYFDSAGNGTIIENVGSVALS